MLDDIRDQAVFQEEEQPPDPKPQKPPKPIRPKRSFDQITGMTAVQRFALVVMLSVIVCVLGTILLMISGKMVP
jgi:hypothetical protein